MLSIGGCLRAHPATLLSTLTWFDFKRHACMSSLNCAAAKRLERSQLRGTHQPNGTDRIDQYDGVGKAFLAVAAPSGH